MSFSTADLHDANPGQVLVCETQFRSFGKQMTFCGPCLPVKVFDDHRPVKALAESPGEGRVLVVDRGGSLGTGLMGDMMTSNAIKNGWAGAVIFGLVRDSQTVNTLDFGIKAIGTTARRGDEETTGIVGAPVSFGGISFQPGWWIYADADAVITSQFRLDGAS